MEVMRVSLLEEVPVFTKMQIAERIRKGYQDTSGFIRRYKESF